MSRLWLWQRPLVVAVSGGIDSTVLLHLLRFQGAPHAPHVCAAHFDHAMRTKSHEDAAWVRGLCRAWDVPLHLSRARTTIYSEADARDARYAFLETVRREVDEEARVLIAHHADDQAETILFRVLRGTGLKGLAGMPATRAPGIARPLLPFWREDIETYAASVGLVAREDPTNRSRDQPRAFLRHSILPELERVVAPGARTSLVRLAQIARDANAVLQRTADQVFAETLRAEGTGVVVLDRDGLASVPLPVLALVLRAAASHLGVRWTEEATARALTTLERPRTCAHVGGGLQVSVTPHEVRIEPLEERVD